MGGKVYQLNYDAIPVLATFFTDGKDVFGKLIHLFAPGDCTHAGLITQDNGWKFATEEDGGLKENSLEKYTKDKDRIVACYYWTGWDDPTKSAAAEEYLSMIRCQRKANSEYDDKGLVSFIPIIGKWKCFQPDPQKQWCSENVLSIHDKFGFNSGWTDKRPPSPAQLEILFQKRRDAANSDVKCVLNYYIGGGHQ